MIDRPLIHEHLAATGMVPDHTYKSLSAAICSALILLFSVHHDLLTDEQSIGSLFQHFIVSEI